MKLLFHHTFTKEYRKLGKSTRVHVQEQLIRFENDPFDPILNNHPLKGKHAGFRSINITGDIRAIYELIENDISHFVALGSHSHLYH